MSNFTADRVGQVNSASDELALFLKMFSGQVMTTYDEKNVMGPLHTVRSISSGKSAQFIVGGPVSTEYHTPGDEIDGQEVKNNEITIAIDNKLIAPVFVADLDEAMAHWDVWAPLAKKMANAMANHTDKNLLQLVVMAARAAATISGGNGGSALTNANYRTVADDLAAGIYDAALTLDEKDVPAEGRTCILRPAQWYLLAQSPTVLNKDFGGKGSYADASSLRIAGVDIIMSNHLPITDLSSAVTEENNDYTADFQNTAGVVFQREAVGTVKLMDLRVQRETTVRHQGTLLVASSAQGHGILRPECSVELKVA